MIRKADRRQASRHRGEFRKCWSPSPGVILDVSPAGLSIETVKRMNPGEWIFVNTSLGSRKLGIPGEVKWIRQVASTRIGQRQSPVYHVGIEVFREVVQPEWDDLVEECAAGRPTTADTREAASESLVESPAAWNETSLDSPAE